MKDGFRNGEMERLCVKDASNSLGIGIRRKTGRKAIWVEELKLNKASVLSFVDGVVRNIRKIS